MKKVVETRQVAHLWANKSQDEARNAGGNFYFTGSRLYSYGSHFVIAMHLDDGARSILWNASRCSNTTSKQQAVARNAMTSFQWERTIRVPHMDDDSTRQLERLHNANPGRTVPDVALACVQSVLTAIEVVGEATQRQNVKRQAAWDVAKDYEASGKALCAYVSHGRSVVKWPLIDLPEQLPMLAEECAVLARKMVKGRMLANVKRDMDAMRGCMNEAQSIIAAADDYYAIQNLTGRLDHAGRFLRSALKGYKAAMGKEMAGHQKHKDALVALYEPAKAKLDTFQRLHALKDLSRFERAAHEIIHARRRVLYRGWSRRVSDVGHFVSKAQDMFDTLNEEDTKASRPLFERMKRIAAFEHARDTMTQAFSSFQSGEDYGIAYPRDAIRGYKKAASNYGEAVCMLGLVEGAKRTPVNVLVRHTMTAEERTRFNPEYLELACRTMESAVIKQNAADIEAWKSGERNALSLGHEGPTFARIKGDEVQTSRGASVPLAHAVRLMSIARRIIAAGGKKWADGEGPQVGGFRVNEIRADGSAVIGCHEFGAEESARMLTVLSLYALANNVNTEEA